eukprot:6305916-Prymnesium_polylepis.1
MVETDTGKLRGSRSTVYTALPAWLVGSVGATRHRRVEMRHIMCAAAPSAENRRAKSAISDSPARPIRRLCRVAARQGIERCVYLSGTDHSAGEVDRVRLSVPLSRGAYEPLQLALVTLLTLSSGCRCVVGGRSGGRTHDAKPLNARKPPTQGSSGGQASGL